MRSIINDICDTVTLDERYLDDPKCEFATTYEADLVRAAQGGDEMATLTLVAMYKSAIISAIPHWIDSDDQERETYIQELLARFCAIVKDHDPSTGRIAKTVRGDLRSAAKEHTRSSDSRPIYVPRVTEDRYRAAMTDAGGDIHTALTQRTYERHEMDRSTFLSAHSALSPASDISDVDTVVEPDDGDDLFLVIPLKAVLEAAQLAPRQREVLELILGLTGEQPMTRSQAAKHLGIETSVAREARTTALRKVRAVITDMELNCA